MGINDIYTEARSYVNGNGDTVFNYPATATISLEDLSLWDGWIPPLAQPLPPHQITKFYSKQAKKDLTPKFTIYNYITDPTGFVPNWSPFQVTIESIKYSFDIPARNYGPFGTIGPISSSQAYGLFSAISPENSSPTYNEIIAPGAPKSRYHTYKYDTVGTLLFGNIIPVTYNEVLYLDVEVVVLNTNTTPPSMTPGYTIHDIITLEGWLGSKLDSSGYTIVNDASNKVGFTKTTRYSGTATVFTGRLDISGHTPWDRIDLTAVLELGGVG